VSSSLSKHTDLHWNMVAPVPIFTKRMHFSPKYLNLTKV
jgi:hypothetical protein